MKRISQICLLGLIVACVVPQDEVHQEESALEDNTVIGTVTCGGRPVGGVPVSDGVNIVKTDADGKYVLQTEKTTGIVFISSPSGYVPGSKDGVKPDFYAYLSDGDSGEVHDFELYKENQDSYSVMFFTDLHLTNADFKPDLKVFRETVMPNVIHIAQESRADGPVYSINLGDISHERWWYKYNYNLQNAYNTLLENDFPTLMYSIPGNHDNDSAVSTGDTDWDAGHLYRKVFGPEYYSVNIGREHWVFLDNIKYKNSAGSSLAVGAAGKLDYDGGLTDTHMKWLTKDLSLVSSDMNVIICSHTTIISDNSKGYTGDKVQVDSLISMLGRFNSTMLYNGHMHTMVFFDSKLYEGFKGMKVPATSGDMWESAPNHLLGLYGEDAGVYVVNFRGDERTDRYVTHQYGEKYMRVYDMNTVADYYNSDSDIRAQMAKYPKRRDYGNGTYKNQILINYWMHKPGQTVQVFEDGKSLSVKSVTYEDPLFNICYHIRTFLKQLPITPSQTTVTAKHMFVAQAKTATSPVTVRILDESGKVIREETLVRPKDFGPDME